MRSVVYAVSRYEDDLNLFATRESAEHFLSEWFEEQWTIANDDSKREYRYGWAMRWRRLGHEAAFREYMYWQIDEKEVLP